MLSLTVSIGKAKDAPDMPEESVLAQISLDSVKVEKLVREFLTAQSLTILPQNLFGDAVSQFVDKDDKHAMELFVEENLVNSIKHLLTVEKLTDEGIMEAMGAERIRTEEMWAQGHHKRAKSRKLKPKPQHWDSDMDGEWADQPGAMMISEQEDDEDVEEESLGSAPPKSAPRRGRGGKATTTSRSTTTAAKKTSAAAKKSAATKSTRGKKRVVEDDEDEDEDEDIIMVDDDEDDEDEETFPPRKPVRATTKAAPKGAVSPAKRAPARSTATRATGRQATLNFSQSQPTTQTQTRQANGRGRVAQEVVSRYSSCSSRCNAHI